MTDNINKYALVVVEISARAVDRPFTYAIPEQLQGQVQLGSIVEVSFGPRKIVGFVVDFTNSLSADAQGAKTIKPILRLLDPMPFWGREILHLAAFMRSFYACTWLESLQTAVPVAVMQRVKAFWENKRAVKVRTSIEVGAAHYPAMTLNDEQRKAVETIAKASQSGKPVLLYGVTGSGKTEVYLHSLQRVLEQGRRAIVLVPELSLTPQAVQRYRGRLQNGVGVLHSALSVPDRRNYWWAMRRGELEVALGTRSAIFAPLDNLGLIVIDEEHESSYKQENAPRYHARQLAYMRAKNNPGCGLVLGSATPSIESYYLAKRGIYELAELNSRPSGRHLPEISVVDMRRSGNKGVKYGKIISEPLGEALRQCIADHQQAVLLINRRGFSSHLQCSECGYTFECENCSISLTWHRRENVLRCHYCDAVQSVPTLCPKCGCAQYKYGSPGTERLLNEVQELMPGVKVARLDRDTTGRQGSHAAILQSFASGEAQILLGTKMVAKGLDYPNVTLVGVLNGDSELCQPDFRASERCFQLLSQVAGRAGRGHLPGQVIIQALNPEHPVFAAVKKHDYHSLFASELSARQQLMYPPFCRLLRIVVSAQEDHLAEYTAGLIARQLSELLSSNEVIVGPAPCPLERIKNRFRWHLLVKGQAIGEMTARASQVTAAFTKSPVTVFLDPDPQSLG